jgi:hypothetical protein
MFKDKISLTEAMSYELLGQITIVDTSPESIAPYPKVGKKWKQAFVDLQSKHRHISPDKLLTFISARYLIEIAEGLVDEDTNTYSWRYLHGVENSKIKAKNIDNVEYVYVLINNGYPDLVKIGMTVTEVHRRVTGLNASSTVDEWVAKFALPVRKGSAFVVEQAVHKHFASVRVSSDIGNSREFFTLSSLTAFDKIREVGALFMVGDPIVY